MSTRFNFFKYMRRLVQILYNELESNVGVIFGGEGGSDLINDIKALGSAKV